MKPYKSWEFCKSIDCTMLRYQKYVTCETCKAYQMHQYLQENGQILEAGSELAKVIELLLEKRRMVSKWQNKPILCTNEELNDHVYRLKDIDCQIDELLAGLEASRDD